MVVYSNKQKMSSRITKKQFIWAVSFLVVLLLAGLSFWIYSRYHSSKNISYQANTHKLQEGNTQLLAVESGLLPWTLQAPLSRMDVYPGPSSNQLVLAGGLTSGDKSTNGIYTLDLTNGNLNNTGTLPSSVHDAAGAMIGTSYGVFGGGVNNSFASTTTFSLNGLVQASGILPQARSDSEAVTIGQLTYIIGGYSGSQADSSVLITKDGKTYSSIGNLPIPVRYPAVAAMGNNIYVFGGEAVGGSHNGQPTQSVQVIDTLNKTISLESWKLPVPLEGALAFNVDNELFLAGGQSTTPETIPTGIGTTQVPGITVSNKSLTYNTIWAVNTYSGSFLQAGTLQLPVAYGGVAVEGTRAWIVGGEYNGQVVSSVQMVTPNSQFGYAGQPGAGSPFYGGHLLVADRGNNRIIVLNPQNQITWSYPSSTTSSQLAGAFYYPDDAFFANHGTEIISNQENNNTIVIISYPQGKLLWTYGHPLVTGTAKGYLNTPDDAYLLKNGDVVVADIKNCRVLYISPSGNIVGQIGNTVCKHIPNQSLGAPNGDTPLFDGNVLISEIYGSWVSEYTPQGKMVWATQLPISFPSDPQQVGASPGVNPDHYLIADYADPGAIIQFTREGKILSEYKVTSGPGMLNSPSLVEILPSGVYMLNDDHRDRMVAIDPATNALVWQYGISDQQGISTGMLYKPDGFDLLLPNGTTPTHLATM